jgi:hypothetical protein
MKTLIALAFTILIATVGTTASSAQEKKYYFCLASPESINVPARTFYLNEVFTAINPIDSDGLAYQAFLLNSSNIHTIRSGCESYASAAQAQARFDSSRSAYLNGAINVIVTKWNPGPVVQAGTSNGDAPTEAGAIYSAQFDATPPAGQYVQNWGAHTCQQVRTKSQYPTSSKTGLYSNPDKISYHCSITFDYSASQTPIARSAIGDAATQALAIDAAKRLPTARHETVVEWGNPICSQTTKITNQYDHSHPSAWWVCEVDYKK